MELPKYDQTTASKMLNAFVPVTRFNKGEVGKIIEEVKQDGIRVIVKNNVPECVMISVEEYKHLSELENRRLPVQFTKEEEAKRKAFIEKIRQNVQPPIPAKISGEERKKLMESIGPIDVDEEAVNELRRISVL